MLGTLLSYLCGYQDAWNLQVPRCIDNDNYLRGYREGLADWRDHCQQQRNSN